MARRADPERPLPSSLPLFDEATLRSAQLAIVGSCARRGDRIALLDLPLQANRDQALAHRNQLGESSYGALYHPWLIVADRLSLGAEVLAVPPSGPVAGVYARCDRLRGVHKPPANEALEGVYDVAQIVDSADHGQLNDNGVNAIRAVGGRGILVSGARTLARDIRYRYVNVRRLLAMIEEALDEQLQWVVFEPNSERLWLDIARTVRNFLERLFRAGMLDGATSEEAYFVRCDASTNPPAESSAGRATCLIGIQPPFPAEFVVIRMGVTRSGVQVEEKGAQDV